MNMKKLFVQTCWWNK